MEVPISTEEKSSKVDKAKVSQPSTLAIKPQQQFPVNSGSLSGANAPSASASVAAASASASASASSASVVASGTNTSVAPRQRPRGNANPGGIKAVPIPPLPSPNQPKAGKNNQKIPIFQGIFKDFRGFSGFFEDF